MSSEDAIQQVSGFTGTTREQAVLLLKKHGDPEKAVNAYFDDPVKALQEEKRGWEEPPPYSQAEIPYGPQNLEGSMFAGAPSRPPSRVDSQRSLVDLTHEKAPAGLAHGLTKEQQEEEDIQRAISNSMNDAPGGQQSGVTGVGQQFGPANREFYDKETWAMVPTTATQEMVDHPPPTERQRRAGEPAFLKPSPYGDRLPSLLTIYHSIPLARETLLLREISTPRYGFDSQWWSGQVIIVPKVVAYGENRDWEDIIFEVQRIMTFLDSTDRAYGSAEALMHTNGYRSRQSDTELTKFFEAWDEAAKKVQNRNIVSSVFSSTALKHDENGPDRGQRKDFYCLEPPVNETEKTMYDVLDRVIWDDSPESLTTGFEDTFIARLGEVFTAQFTSHSLAKPGCGIAIPSVWYPDRYLNETRKEALDMRRRAQQHRLEAEKVERQIDQVLKHRLSNGKFVDAKETLLRAVEAAEMVGKNEYPSDLPEGQTTADEDGAKLSAADITKCAENLRALVEKLDEKVQALRAEQQRAVTACEDVLKDFTERSSAPASKPNHRYTLRGISTLPHITYFRKRREVDLLVAEDLNNDEWEWWRASFSHEDGKIQQQERMIDVEVLDAESGLAADEPGLSASQLLTKSNSDDTMGYTLKRVSEADVLRAAQEESKSVLVVYASDAAVNYEGSDVNQHLQAFVNADNKAFAAELRGEDMDFEMTSNKSSMTLANEDQLHDDDSDLEPLIDLNRVSSKPSSPVLSQSTGTVTYRRGGEDGESQPSPKRSKGYDERMSLSPVGDDLTGVGLSRVSTSTSSGRTETEKAAAQHIEHVK